MVRWYFELLETCQGYPWLSSKDLRWKQVVVEVKRVSIHESECNSLRNLRALDRTSGWTLVLKANSW